MNTVMKQPEELELDLAGLEEAMEEALAVDEVDAPARLQSWQVGQLLHRSGSVMTFAARDREGRRAALKVRTVSASAVAAWRREISLYSGIDHPNIPRLYDRGTALQPFIAMELVRGGTIAETHHVFDLHAFDRHVEEALSALEAIHGAGFVIRTIDESSVLVDEHGSVKLVGFAGAERSNDPALRVGDLVALANVLMRASEVGLPSRLADVLFDGTLGAYRSAAAMHEAWLEATEGDVIDVTDDLDIEIDDEPVRHASGVVPAVAASVARAS